MIFINKITTHSLGGFITYIKVQLLLKYDYQCMLSNCYVCLNEVNNLYKCSSRPRRNVSLYSVFPLIDIPVASSSVFKTPLCQHYDWWLMYYTC